MKRQLLQALAEQLGKDMDELSVLQVSLELGLGGGSESVAFELHRAWLQLGIDACALTSLTTEAEATQGITLVLPWLALWNFRAKWRHLVTLLTIPLFTLAATWRVRRNRGSKIVLSHGDVLTGDVCVVHAVNRAALVEKQRSGYYGWLLNPTNLWVAWRDWWMLGGRRYRKVVAISERVRRQLKEHYHVPDEQIVTIPNGVNLSRYQPGTKEVRHEVREEFQIPQDVPLLLFVGNQYRLKGLEFVIRALPKMEAKALLLVVGRDAPGPFERLTEQLGLSDRVIFAGSRSDLPRIYAAADALVLPTLYETFALVCLEAMATGLPVFATKVGGIEDYLSDGVNGFLIERRPEDIAKKLDKFLSDSILRNKISKQGLATAENYSWAKIAKKYLVLFDELMLERSRQSGSRTGDHRWKLRTQELLVGQERPSV
jgi:UDP-glucose:(heptosyl)LPS alpha-1,3-glucosyltransferase